jgi:hypothetical protein
VVVRAQRLFFVGRPRRRIHIRECPSSCQSSRSRSAPRHQICPRSLREKPHTTSWEQRPGLGGGTEQLGPSKSPFTLPNLWNISQHVVIVWPVSMSRGFFFPICKRHARRTKRTRCPSHRRHHLLYCPHKIWKRWVLHAIQSPSLSYTCFQFSLLVAPKRDSLGMEPPESVSRQETRRRSISRFNLVHHPVLILFSFFFQPCAASLYQGIGRKEHCRYCLWPTTQPCARRHWVEYTSTARYGLCANCLSGLYMSGDTMATVALAWAIKLMP